MSVSSGNEFSPHEVEWTDEKENRIWDFYSSSQAHQSTYFGESVGDHVAKVMRRRGLLGEGAVVVDFSCGTGALIESILKVAPSQLSVYGADPSRTSVEITNRRNKGNSKFKGAYQLEGLPSGLEESFADLVVLTEVVEHLDDQSLSMVIKECQRILVPGGRLMITTPNDECLDRGKVLCPDCGCIFHRWQHQRSWTSSSLKNFLASNGFSSVSSSEITWGSDLINLAFRFFRRKPTGVLAVAEK